MKQLISKQTKPAPVTMNCASLTANSRGLFDTPAGAAPGRPTGSLGSVRSWSQRATWKLFFLKHTEDLWRAPQALRGLSLVNQWLRYINDIFAKFPPRYLTVPPGSAARTASDVQSAGSCPPDRPFDQQVSSRSCREASSGAGREIAVAQQLLAIACHETSVTSTSPMPQNKALTGATRST